jgi:hypothetical protein
MTINNGINKIYFYGPTESTKYSKEVYKALQEKN